MTIGIGIGIGLGSRLIGTEPSEEVEAPPVILEATSGISIVGLEALSPADFTTAVPGMQVLSLGSIGVTLNGGGVSGWTDLSGNGRNWANGGAESVCGVYTASDAGLGGGRGSIAFNGSSQNIANAWNPPAPGTTKFWARIIAKHISRVNSGQLLCSQSSARLSIRSKTTGADVEAGNGSALTAGISMTLGTWFAVDVEFNNATSDYLHIGATKQTGAALGSVDPSSIGLGARSGNDAVWGNFAVAGIMIANAEPAGRLTTLNALCAKWWKGNVTLPS